MPKRTCRICGKVLASKEYNPEDICFCHQEGMVIKERTAVTGCTSYESKNRDLDQDANHQHATILFPGDPGYNERVFTEEVVGAIDENGELYEIDLGDAPFPKGEDVYDDPDTIVNIEIIDI
jgi:hypothetical protein